METMARERAARRENDSEESSLHWTDRTSIRKHPEADVRKIEAPATPLRGAARFTSERRDPL